jgi:transcriptional regulator with XRE-family HTH domain
LLIDGNKLLKERTKKNLDRMQIGTFLGVTYQRVAQLEKPGKHNINPHVLAALAEKLGVKADELQ